MTTGPETPFPKHRYYYIALKLVIIVAAILLAAHFLGRWS